MATAFNPYPYLADDSLLLLAALGDFLLLFCLALTGSLGAVWLLRRWMDR